MCHLSTVHFRNKSQAKKTSQAVEQKLFCWVGQNGMQNKSLVTLEDEKCVWKKGEMTEAWLNKLKKQLKVQF